MNGESSKNCNNYNTNVNNIVSLTCNETISPNSSLRRNGNKVNNRHNNNNNKVFLNADEKTRVSHQQQFYKHFVLPKFDSNLFDDDRVLSNLLKSEDRCLASNKYFSCVQTEIQEPMRKTLTEWMLEVSEEEMCDSEVFPLAVSYVDRFLSCEAVHKSQLQVLGCACLFLASKVKQPQPICARRLVEYSANSIGLSELMSWELLVLNRLKWDLGTVTACEFLDHMLYKLALPPFIEQKLRPHLQFFVALIATEYKLAVVPPSVVAVSCLCVAFGRLLKDVGACGRMLSALRPILKADTYAYEPYVETVYNFIDSVARRPSSNAQLSTKFAHQNQIDSSDSNSDSPPPHCTGTPTDIRDVEFP